MNTAKMTEAEQKQLLEETALTMGWSGHEDGDPFTWMLERGYIEVRTITEVPGSDTIQ